MSEIEWLALTALMTGLFWVPYIINRLAEDGVLAALSNPNPDLSPKSQWANRMMKAHANAVENLVVYAPLVLAVAVMGLGSALTLAVAKLYFFARLAHFVIYTLGIPFFRTIAFAIGSVCQVILALVVLGWL